MKQRKSKSSLAFALSVLCATATFAQTPGPSPSPSTTGNQRKADEIKRTKSRVRRTNATRQLKPATQPVAATEPAPTPTASPVPEAPATNPEPEVTPESPTADTPIEKAAVVKEIAPPTPEERLREQLKAVEQMVAQGQRQEALAELHSLAAEDRFDPQGFFNIGNAFARLDATDAAVSSYRKAIAQRNGHYSRALNNMGVVLLRQGFWDQAYEALVSALRLENFRYAEASYNLGRLYASRGEMDRAAREWKRAVAVDPKHAAAAAALGNPEGPGGMSPAPAPASAPVRTSASEPKPAPSKSSSASKAENKSVRTGQPFNLNPETHALLQQGRTAHERGRYEDALTNFRKVISRMGGYFAPANLELSYSLIELRRNEEAIAQLLRVAEKDGARFPISYYHLGRLYEMLGDLKLAEENFLRATQAYQTENAQFLLNLSTVREKRGDFKGALVAMESYVKRKEQEGQKPDWSDARLASLREKAATTKP